MIDQSIIANPAYDQVRQFLTLNTNYRPYAWRFIPGAPSGGNFRLLSYLDRVKFACRLLCVLYIGYLIGEFTNVEVEHLKRNEFHLEGPTPPDRVNQVTEYKISFGFNHMEEV